MKTRSVTKTEEALLRVLSATYLIRKGNGWHHPETNKKFRFDTAKSLAQTGLAVMRAGPGYWALELSYFGRQFVRDNLKEADDGENAG